MAQFLYLIRNGEQSPSSPEKMQQQMQRWVAWMKELGDKGHLKDPGQPIEASGKLVRGKGKKTITDGPYAEKDLVGGYMIVEAESLAHAAELSSGCPIFEAGGAVEVRPVMKFNP